MIKLTDIGVTEVIELNHQVQAVKERFGNNDKTTIKSINKRNIA